MDWLNLVRVNWGGKKNSIWCGLPSVNKLLVSKEKNAYWLWTLADPNLQNEPLLQRRWQIQFFRMNPSYICDCCFYVDSYFCTTMYVWIFWQVRRLMSNAKLPNVMLPIAKLPNWSKTKGDTYIDNEVLCRWMIRIVRLVQLGVVNIQFGNIQFGISTVSYDNDNDNTNLKTTPT
jgi:hypothetical protein